jgi:peptidoglycan/xylan/chitin deacetylase (PgdA/CDA1 family)
MIFWDFDTQWGADRCRGRSSPRVQSWGSKDFNGVERLLAIHSEYNVPACFAIVGSAALPGSRPYHDPDLIRQIHLNGHEVASHTHRHDWIPGMTKEELLRTLRESKEVLEQCIGAPVLSFVPPYNQPWDFPQRLAFSFSERREVRGSRIDVTGLCSALAESGYQFCRLLYRNVFAQIAKRLTGRTFPRPESPQVVAGIVCLRLNVVGFGADAHKMLDVCLAKGGCLVTYGHPRGVLGSGDQSEDMVRRFFERIAYLRDAGALSIVQPRDIVRMVATRTV